MTREQELEAELAQARLDIEGWKRVAVGAVAPLEAMLMSGSVKLLAPMLQDAVLDGISTVRAAVMSNVFPDRDKYLKKAAEPEPQPVDRSWPGMVRAARAGFRSMWPLG